MTQHERDRLVVLKKAQKKLVTQRQAAVELELSERHVRRKTAVGDPGNPMVDQFFFAETCCETAGHNATPFRGPEIIMSTAFLRSQVVSERPTAGLATCVFVA